MKSQAILFSMLVALLPPAVVAQELFETSTGITPLKGYVKAVSGETLNYNCFHPLATTALLTRCTGGDMKIEWETEPIPRDAKGDAVYFKWIVSYSTITSAGNRTFDFFINDRKTFAIKTHKGVNAKEWGLKADNGSELTFQFVREDAARDANGYMYLKVPVGLFKKGAPLRLRVVGEKANSSDWFMTFMYDLRENTIDVIPLPFLTRGNNTLHQTICVAIATLREDGKATVSLDNGKPESKSLTRGTNTFEFSIPAVKSPRAILVKVSVDGAAPESFNPKIQPVVQRTIHLLPHSHNDIGYTDIQTDVLKKQVKNVYDALDLIKKTSSYPPEARFKWNVEVLWGVESFMKEAPEHQRKEFLDAVRNGSISIQGLYANVLTGIMRPEEFYRLTEYARSLKKEFGITVKTAMMSDVPGMTWNMVPTVAQAGIRYFSSGPNGPYTGGDRTGHTNRAWADRPFYWVSPSGSERILYWMTGFGYGSFFANMSSTNANQLNFLRSVSRYFDWLDAIAYPYDMIQMRHTINGDNGTVDPDLPRYVKTWNEKYVSPRITISTAEQLFEEFERKYGALLPTFSGDFTPYWEDGAASTALELGMNRTTAEELVQTEALCALGAPQTYDRKRFYEAWRDVLLFSEHTWGAHNSITDPDSAFVLQQWEIKQRFARDASTTSAGLRREVLAAVSGNETSGTFDVINTHSWQRTDLVTVPRSMSTHGDVVMDEEGQEVPSQRLTTGDLAFLAGNVPGFGAKRYTVCPGRSSFKSGLTINGSTITDESLSLSLDEQTGSIRSLKTRYPSRELVDTTRGRGLNEYLYVAGLDAREALGSSKPTITIRERGPLVASFVIVSDAPGCRSITREITMIYAMGRVEITNTIDKEKVRAKEAVHFGFPFAVPQGVVRLDLGFGVIRPEADQLAGSCKDYFSVQRWADVSNQDFGVSLSVREAPLIEVGELHSELPSPRNVNWKTSTGPSSYLASYVMNNYWHTNYKADQEGISTYHYSIRPHGLFNQAEVVREGIARSQPFIICPARKDAAGILPPFAVAPGNVIATSLKPIEGGRGYIVRLFNAGGSPEVATFTIGGKPKSVYLSDPWEERGKLVEAIALPANGITTVRVE